MIRAVILLMTLAMVATACGDSGNGGGSLSEGEQALADAISASIMADTEPGDPFGQAEADCIGEEAVGQFGVDGLLEIGISESSPDPGNAFEGASDEQIDKVVDVTLECVDFVQVFVDEATAGGEISDESAECLGEAIDDPDILRPLVAAGLRGGDTDITDEPEAAEKLFQAVVDCLSVEELRNLGD